MDFSEYYTTVMDLSHGIVVSTDESGRIVHTNTRFDSIFGKDDNGVLHKNWLQNFCVPEEKELWSMLASFRGKREQQTLRSVLRVAKGQMLHIDWNLKPLFDSFQEIASVLWVGVDVTAHMERQQILERERDHLEALNRELTCLHAMNRIVSDMESDMAAVLREILSTIPPAFTYPENTGVRLVLDGHPLVCGNFSLDAPVHMEEQVLVQGVRRGRLCVTVSGQDEAGNDCVFRPTEHDLLLALSRHVGWIIARRESLQTKKHLEQQLQHADRLAKIGQFASGMAHELNEPLGNILGFAQLAVQTPKISSQLRQDLETIVKFALHSREIIRKLMIFSRQMPLRRSPLNLNDVVSEALSFTEMSAVKKKIRVRTQLEENLPNLLADRQHLVQVVVNLVVNALHASESGGQIVLETAAYEDDIYLTVCDVGVGMSAEVLRHIFTPFFTTKPVDQGTGLGLSVVHGIVTAHGGVLDVRSTEGQGTCVEIAFPCVESISAQEE